MRISQDGDFIEELNATISGGLAVLVDSVEELAALQALSIESDGLEHFSNRIQRYDQWLADFERDQREYEIRVERALETLSDKSPNNCSDMERLFLSQTFIRQIWQETRDEDLEGL